MKSEYPQEVRSETPKKNYASPSLVIYGNVAKMTMAITGAMGDGGGAGMQP